MPEPYSLDKDSLRDQQLKYKDEAADKNEGDDYERNYRTLSRVWVPMALDHIGRRPWTLDEIIDAMMPIIQKFAREYGGLRGSYHFDDAFSDAMNALLRAIYRDKGIAPFGKYAAKEIVRAVQKGAKGASLVPIPHRERTYTDKDITSLQAAASGESDIQVGSHLGGDAETAARVDCPVCGKKGEVDGEQCDLCNGRGWIIVGDQVRKDVTPADDAAEIERVKLLKHTISRLLHEADLPDRQMEIVLLSYGIEGVYDPTIKSSGEPRMQQAIARILGVADTILKRDPNTGEASGMWAEAERRGLTDEFQNVWHEVAQEMADHDFDPELPASLQLSMLANTPSAEEGYADRLEELSSKLRERVIDMPVKSISRQLVVNLLKKANAKLQAAKDKVDFKKEEGMEEGIAAMVSINYNLVVEAVNQCVSTEEFNALFEML